jgi:hypothetical protein
VHKADPNTKSLFLPKRLKRRKLARVVTISFSRLIIIDKDMGMSGRYCLAIYDPNNKKTLNPVICWATTKKHEENDARTVGLRSGLLSRIGSR